MIPDSSTISTQGKPDSDQSHPLGRHDAYALIALLGITVAAVGIRWYYDNWIVDYDIVTQFLPWYGFLGDSIRDWNVPAWNPADSGGAPFAGVSGSGWLNLPIMLVFAAFPVITAYKIYALSLSLISGFATYLFSRKIGLSTFASLGGAVALAVGPMLYGSTMFGLPNSQITAFVPLGVLAAEGAMKSPRLVTSLGWSALGGLALSQMYVGSAPRFMYGAMYVFGWIMFRTVVSASHDTDRLPTRLQRAGLVAAAMAVIAAGFSAAAVLPQIHILSVSSVAGVDYSNLIGGDYVADPHSWSTVLQHHFSGKSFRFDRTLLVGAAVVVLSIFAVVRARFRLGTPFFAIATLVFIDLTATFSLTRPLLYLLPQFEQINSHRQSASEAMFFFAIAMLAGIGIHMFQEQLELGAGSKWSALLTTVLFIGLIIVCALAGVWIGWPQVIVGGLTCFVLTLPWFRRVSGRSFFTQRLCSFAVVSLLMLILVYPTVADFGRALVTPSGQPNYTRTIAKDLWVSETIDTVMGPSDPGSAADLLQYQQSISAPFRYAPFTGTADLPETYISAAASRNDPSIVAILANGRATRLGLEQVPGYNPIHLNHYVEYIDAMNGSRQDYHYLDVMTPAIDGSLLFDMLNVRFVLVPADLGFTPPIANTGIEVYRDALVIVYENPSYFQRAWIVHDVRPNNDGEGLQQLASGAVDGRVTAFVDIDGQLPEVAPVATGADADWLNFEDRSDDFLRFRVGTTQPGLAVISQSYEEGWVAYVDGQKTDVIRTNHALIGVPVAAGEHQIELRYEPQSLTTGLWITSGTTAVMLGLWIFAGIAHLQRRSQFIDPASAFVPTPDMQNGRSS